MERLAVTGVGVVSPAGIGFAAFCAALRDPSATKQRAFELRFRFGDRLPNRAGLVLIGARSEGDLRQRSILRLRRRGWDQPAGENQGEQESQHGGNLGEGGFVLALSVESTGGSESKRRIGLS